MTLHTLTIDTLGGLRRRMPGLDSAWMALGVLLALIAVLLPDRIGETLRFTGSSILQLSPFLLASVALAAYLKAAGAERLIQRVFTGRPLVMILGASAFGALSPFCSCGVIPIIAGLLSLGVPLPPVMAFWLASPVMAPDMFLLTAGALGLNFAVAKTLAALGLGLLGGLGTMLVMRMGAFAEPLRAGVGDGGCAAGSVRTTNTTQWAFWKDGERTRIFFQNAADTALFLLKWLLLAFVLESLMLAYLPPEVIGRWLGGDSLLAIPIAVAVGVPAYLNGYAAVPMVAGLIETGMSPGAALAFMTAGAVTSLPAAIAVFALVRRWVFGWYLLLSLLGSTAVGVLYQIALSW